MRYTFGQIAEYLLLRAGAGLVNALPYRAALLLACGVARLSFLCLGKKMKKTRRRLVQVFGTQYSDRELRRITWLAWRNFFFSMMEVMRTPSVTMDWIHKHIELSGYHLATENMKEGRGIILAVPHMGNWELAGIAVQKLGTHLMVIFRRLKNPLTDAFMNRMREYTGVEAVARDSNMFAGVIRKLSAGYAMAILPDIRAKTAAVQVDFLGVKADISRGMAVFARAANVPILPAYVMREGWSRHRWHGFDAVWPDLQVDKDADIQRMTQQVMRCLEQAIREHPDQYFWFNGRWVLGAEPQV